MSQAPEQLGTKLVCPTCKTKFYNFGKNENDCPSCGETFDLSEDEYTVEKRVDTETNDYNPDVDSRDEFEDDEELEEDDDSDEEE